ncbi:TetR family transcriptional regulator [Methylocystis bryophila]|uniref:TetR family transcriptional regulator n=1 Tax=Methylocystis bryophila TaxID=655015 RepID=A0A1W6MXB1_9HYPH|nr:TetR family transcriptional regulator [Methylocystis bryophila]ARN82227.1 TetR family transcriptional regulator [Methylocystis bryophila]
MKVLATQTKSERTQAAILAAAEALFAKNGYERTTLRDIAALARIDPAMIIRYFDSKDALFARVATFDLMLPDLRTVERSAIGTTLVRHFLRVWEGERGNSGLAILLRSAASNEHAAKKLRELFKSQVMPALKYAGADAYAAERAGLVASQLLGLALCRYVLKLPPAVTMSREFIVAEVGKTIQRYVAGDE